MLRADQGEDWESTTQCNSIEVISHQGRIAGKKQKRVHRHLFHELGQQSTLSVIRAVAEVEAGSKEDWFAFFSKWE